MHLPSCSVPCALCLVYDESPHSVSCIFIHGQTPPSNRPKSCPPSKGSLYIRCCASNDWTVFCVTSSSRIATGWLMYAQSFWATARFASRRSGVPDVLPLCEPLVCSSSTVGDSMDRTQPCAAAVGNGRPDRTCNQPRPSGRLELRDMVLYRAGPHSGPHCQGRPCRRRGRLLVWGHAA